jgi:formate dehydrogenase (NADP+) alpha subunit
MMKGKRLTLTIDNRNVTVRAGVTILEAARRHEIYIPSLCALEGLPPFGGCRMCIVEVDGLRGFPTSCTTPVEEGMVIRTDSAEIRGLRQEILKLLLSEHPGSCLFCDEKDECGRFQDTIRKAGMTTGCRHCPKDGRCEIQEITEKVGLAQTSHHVYYRNFEVEKDDPFYDRDYNLCVLCGRCVRVCSTVRMNGTLSFKQRGKLTTIGPAFDRSHIEGGCEFCGACVNVCPTGTLSAKTSKWYGKPEKETATTCPYCSIGCRLVVQVKHDKVIDVLPDYDAPVDHGLLCVKGRFGVPEFVNSPLRLTEPRELASTGYKTVSWDRALDAAAERLSAVSPEDFLMLLSPQASNEDLFVAQRFARQVMGSENLISLLSVELGDGFAAFLDLACRSDAIDTVDEGELIFLVGFDPRYGYSPLGVRVRKAAGRGAKLVSLNDFDTSLDILADRAFKTGSIGWVDFLEEALLGRRGQGAKEDGIEAFRQDISRASRKVLIVGPEVLRSPGREELLAALVEVKNSGGWKIIMAHPHTNLAGMVAMGALSNVNPGDAVVKTPLEGLTNGPFSTKPVDIRAHRKVIYVIGEACPDWLPTHDYLIYQNGVPAYSSFQPNLILPSILFAESIGSMINVEGRLLTTEKAVEPPGESKPDWWILSRLVEKMGKAKLTYEDVESVRRDMRKRLRVSPETGKRVTFASFQPDKDRRRTARGGEPETPGEDRKGAYLLYHKREIETYRGLPLSEVVPGMKQIGNRGYVLVNTKDAAELGVKDNGQIDIGWNGRYLQFPVHTSSAVNSGILHLMAGERAPFGIDPCPVDVRRTDEQGL